MTEFIPTEHPHTRFNPLNGEWVLVSPHRMKRPWSGQEESSEESELTEFDPTNPLCPGVTRANGALTAKYDSTYVFPNDFPALLADNPDPPESDDPLFQMGSARGSCEVMCFHPKSNMRLATMSLTEIEAVIYQWIVRYNELSKIYTWVQIFENKGATMGCSNMHPHCQIWSSSFFPTNPKTKDTHLRAYHKTHGRPLLDDYVDRELVKRERIVIENCDWLVVVPYWAVWPFETLLISRNKHKRIHDLTPMQVSTLAEVIKELTTKYDNLFKCSFPYSMGFVGAPSGHFMKEDMSHWTLHASYFPPLLRSATVRKFLVGYELMCQAQRDLTPEQAADRLRQLDGKVHYSELK